MGWAGWVGLDVSRMRTVVSVSSPKQDYGLHFNVSIQRVIVAHVW